MILLAVGGLEWNTIKKWEKYLIHFNKWENFFLYSFLAFKQEDFCYNHEKNSVFVEEKALKGRLTQ